MGTLRRLWTSLLTRLLAGVRDETDSDPLSAYSRKVTNALVGKRLNTTIEALRQGPPPAAADHRPDATLLDPDPERTVARALAANAPEDQRAQLVVALDAQKSSMNEYARIHLWNAGVRSQASLAAAVTQLVDTALRLGGEDTLSQEQLTHLVIVIDQALAETFRDMTPIERATAFDAVLIEAGTMSTLKHFDAAQGTAMASACLGRFGLR